MKTAPEMAWTDHPCTTCGTGYRACCQFWVFSKMCCKDCDHPTRWAQAADQTDSTAARNDSSGTAV